VKASRSVTRRGMVFDRGQYIAFTSVIGRRYYDRRRAR
jgi:hypothetical protein